MLPLLALSLLVVPSTTIDGDVAVVTTDGLWMVHPQSAQVAQLLSAATFGLPAGLREPTVSWIPDSDSLLVTSRAPAGSGAAGSLFRVDVTGASSATLLDLTPSVGIVPAPDWIDVDVSRGLDAAFLLDALGRVFVLGDPAHADGGALAVFGDSTVQQPRSIAVDAAHWPLGTVVLGRFETRRLIAGGATEVLAASSDNDGWRDVDANPVTSSVYFANETDDLFGEVFDGLLHNGNAWGTCARPVKSPSDIDWDAGTNKYIVLAADGVDCLFNQVAMGFANHVVRMPFAQIVGPGPLPPNAEPALLTPPGDTGITGTDGDLAIIRHVAPDTTFFGAAGVPSAGPLPKFDNAGYQGGFRQGKLVFVQLKQAPAAATAVLAMGFDLLGLPFQGQILYPSLDLLVPTTTDTEGRASISFKMPVSPGLAGLKVFMQWWIDDVSSPGSGDLVGSHGAISVIDD